MEIQKQLGEGTRHCAGQFDIIDAELLASLHLSLGQRLLSFNDFENGRRALESSSHLMEPFGKPSLIWLGALRDLAEAALQSDDLEDAQRIATIQSALARRWVEQHRFLKTSLADALRFEARVLSRRNSPERANELEREAARLEGPEQID